MSGMVFKENITAGKAMKIVKRLAVCLLFTVSFSIFSGDVFAKTGYSPAVQKLSALYNAAPEALDKAFANAITPPTGVCSDSPVTEAR